MKRISMRRRLLSVVAILLALFMILSSCAIGGTSGKKEDTTTSKKEDTTTKKEPPAKFSIFYQEGGQIYPDDFKHGDNWVINHICELANVELTEVNVPVYQDTLTKFNLMMSSGNIPDLVERADPNAMKDYGKQGAFLPTRDIIKNSPVISKFYDETQLKAMESSDGVAYVIQIPPLNDDFNMMYVRWDLLQKLGYTEVPETLDEWVEACRKLKKYDPNSIPISSRVGMAYAWIATVPFNIPANGAGWMYYPERGKVCNAWEGDNIIKSITFGKQLYDEGLWDKEFPTTEANEYMQKKEQNSVMFQYNNFGGFTGWLNRYNLANMPEVRLLPVRMPMAEGVGVDEWYFAPSVLGSYTWGINANTKQKEGVIRFLEVLYSDEVKNLSIYGREGIEYKVVNNEKVAIEPAANDSAWRSVYGWMTVNCKEQLDKRVPGNINASTVLTDTEKADYIKLVMDGAEGIRNRIYGKLSYNPMSLADFIDDDLRNLVPEVTELQVSMVTKAIIGEMSIEQFIVEKENLVKKYQHITDAYNKVTDKAKLEYGLK